eukprot:scaffold5772_cov188-Amphora_coffeaeformis.AAC.13
MLGRLVGILSLWAWITVGESFFLDLTSLTRSSRPPSSVQQHQLAAISNAMQVWCDCRIRATEHEGEEDQPRQQYRVDVMLFQDGAQQRATTQLDDDTVSWTEKERCLLDQNGRLIGIVLDITNVKEQQQAMAVLGSVEWILVHSSTDDGAPSSSSSSDWKMIPAENLIAAAESTGTKLAFQVNAAAQVGGLARALERGVDALCVSYDADPAVWKAVFRAQTERQTHQKGSTTTTNKSPLSSATTTTTIATGACWRRETTDTILADRVCVDFVRVLRPQEGCWIGSSAKVMALVLSEAATSQFVPTRPFRVNAGPVHSYILMADNSTKYLSELQAADQVHVYDSATGESRSVAVGRLKQEIRPCVLMNLQLPGSVHEDEDCDSLSITGQIFLQQAETVRLGSEGGSFQRVTDFEAQDHGDATKPILLRVQSTGTHIGMAYSGKVTER